MAINTVMQYDLIDGTKIDLSMTFGKLLKAKEKYPKEYESFNRVEMDGAKDIFDYVDILYMGYICENIENPMSKDEFMEKINPNRTDLIVACAKLTHPKKNGISAKNLKNSQQKAAAE